MDACEYQQEVDRRLKLEFHGSTVTSDAGLLAYRELDEALGMTVMGEGLLNDWRTGKNTRHSMRIPIESRDNGPRSQKSCLGMKKQDCRHVKDDSMPMKK